MFGAGSGVFYPIILEHFDLCARARMFTPLVRAFMHESLQKLVHYYLKSLSFKFNKDRSFRCGDISKTILVFFNR